MEIEFILICLYLLLLIIGVVFLRGAMRRKNNTQTIIFSVCVAFCVYAVLHGFWDSLQIRQAEREYDKATFKNLSPGDTATFAGTIYFNVPDPYDNQDSVNRLWQINNNRVYVMMPVEELGIR